MGNTDQRPASDTGIWILRCPACGRTGDARKAGIIRVGAWSPLGKYVLGWCSNCRRLRMLNLVQADHACTDTQADETWKEVSAYVASKTIDAQTAEQIIAANVPEERKREIAAYIAEGMMEVDDALRMLNA